MYYDCGLATPPDNTTLWRYMDLSAFLHMLLTSSLHFSRTCQLPDPWEGKPSSAVRAYLQHIAEGAVADVIVDKLFRFYSESAAISCWHRNCSESIAMWKLYTKGNDGIAIRTTVGKLKRAVTVVPQQVLIAEVKYTDFSLTILEDASQTPLPPVHGPNNEWSLPYTLFEKRSVYEHEREVRAVIDYGSAFLFRELKRASEPNFQGLEFPPDGPKEGVLIPVNLPTFIEQIVVAPTYPEWAKNSLDQVIASFGIPIAAEYSKAFVKPKAIFKAAGG